jgi:hypothetical protein
LFYQGDVMPFDRTLFDTYESHLPAPTGELRPLPPEGLVVLIKSASLHPKEIEAMVTGTGTFRSAMADIRRSRPPGFISASGLSTGADHNIQPTRPIDQAVSLYALWAEAVRPPHVRDLFANLFKYVNN